MTYKHIVHYLAAALTLLALVWSVGSGHMAFNRSSMSHDKMANCQTSCVPLLNEKQKTPKFDKEADPEPLLFNLITPLLSQGTIYAVLLSTLILLYLQRRPPDKLSLNSIYRI